MEKFRARAAASAALHERSGARRATAVWTAVDVLAFTLLAVWFATAGRDLLFAWVSAHDDPWRYELAGWLELAFVDAGRWVLLAFLALALAWYAVTRGRAGRLGPLPGLYAAAQRSARAIFAQEPDATTRAGMAFDEQRWVARLRLALLLFALVVAAWLLLVAPVLVIVTALAAGMWLWARQQHRRRRNRMWSRLAARQREIVMRAQPARDATEVAAWVSQLDVGRARDTGPVRAAPGASAVARQLPSFLRAGARIATLSRRVVGSARHGSVTSIGLMRGLMPVFRAMTSLTLGVALLWILALLLAIPLGLATLPPDRFSYAGASASELLLTRAGATPALATAALERALLTGNPHAVRAVLVAGSRDGVFSLQGWRHASRCPESPAGLARFAGQQVTFAAIPISTDAAQRLSSGVLSEPWRFRLADVSDADTLARLAACARDPGRMPFAYAGDAIRVAGGQAPDAHAAVAAVSLAFLSNALELGAPLEARDWQGRTPLLAALDRLADRELDPASARELRSIANLLLRRGADIDARDHAGRSGVRLALAANLGDDDPLPGLLAAAAIADRDRLHATLVHAAAAAGRVDAARRLVQLGVDARATTVDGRTALHFARGREMVAYLLLLGLSADAVDSRLRTPLHLAVIAEDVEATQALAAVATDRFRRDLLGRAALDYAPPASKAWAELAMKLRAGAAP